MEWNDDDSSAMTEAHNARSTTINYRSQHA